MRLIMEGLSSSKATSRPIAPRRHKSIGIWNLCNLEIPIDHRRKDLGVHTNYYTVHFEDAILTLMAFV
jgi:hypothetical protein